MVTLAQRIIQLRDQRGLSRPALAAALGFPKGAVEKFETGRQTPSKEQLEALASYFQVSVFYLRGESDDPTRQETWMDRAWAEEDAPAPAASPRPQPVRTPRAGEDSGTVFSALMSSKPFQDLVRSTVLEVLRSPEGQAILERTVKKELDRQK